MGTIRRGKAGLKRYLLERLHRVKEVFRNEINSRDQLKAKDMEPVIDKTIDETTNDKPQEKETVSQGTQGTVDTSSTTEGTQGISSTPQAPEPEVTQVLHVQHRGEPKSADSVPLQKGLKEYKDSAGRKQVTWTEKSMKKVRKVMDICTWTMMISSLAVERDPEHWKLCRPIKSETGYNLLTKSGRKKADKYLESEKPDLIVAEWMCSPFSSTQNFNLGKGGAVRERILQEQRKHKKVNIWIAEKEKWQREFNKGVGW